MSVDLLAMSGGTGLSDKSTCNAFLPLSLRERGSGGEGRQRDSTPVVSGGRAPVMSDGKAEGVSS